MKNGYQGKKFNVSPPSPPKAQPHDFTENMMVYVIVCFSHVGRSYVYGAYSSMQKAWKVCLALRKRFNEKTWEHYEVFRVPLK